MRLLLDENLSRRLLRFLEHDFPGSRHIGDLGLEQASDDEIWRHAARDGYVIVTRDSDFRDMSRGSRNPAGLIWLGFGNCRNARVIHALTSQKSLIERAFALDGVAILEIR